MPYSASQSFVSFQDFDEVFPNQSIEFNTIPDLETPFFSSILFPDFQNA